MAGAGFWPLQLARQLEDAVLHLRVNELDIGTLILRSEGDAALVEEHDRLLVENDGDWLLREVALYWKRLLKRVDATSRTLICLIEPGSCFVGFLAELVLACDRAYMLEGAWSDSDEEAGMIAHPFLDRAAADGEWAQPSGDPVLG